MWHQNFLAGTPQRTRKEPVEDEQEEASSQLNTSNCGAFLEARYPLNTSTCTCFCYRIDPAGLWAAAAPPTHPAAHSGTLAESSALLTPAAGPSKGASTQPKPACSPQPALCTLQVGRDKLTVGYIGKGAHPDDVGSIQGSWPVPKARVVYYFEVLIKAKGEKGDISIGFTDEHFKMGRAPGYMQSAVLLHFACSRADT